MELYTKYPKLTTVWCCLEIFLFAGLMFGWNSLLFILKQEGFYLRECYNENSEFAPHSSDPLGFVLIRDGVYNYNNNSLGTGDNQPVYNVSGEVEQCIKSTISSIYGVSNATLATIQGFVAPIKLNKIIKTCSSERTYDHINVNPGEQTDQQEPEAQMMQTCATQDSKLNLWFSVALGFSYIMCSTLGPIMHKIGMKFFRLFFLLLFVVGCMCLGFASPVVPWLVCPGLCCVGLSGMALYASNLQVSFLFPTVQSTITSVLVGLFDGSTVLAQVIKVAFEQGIPRKHSFIVFACLHVILVGISTFFLFPSDRLVPSHVKSKRTSTDKEGAGYQLEEKDRFIHDTKKEKEDDIPVVSTMMSAQYLLHVYWMCVLAIRFVTYLGFMSVQMDSLFLGDKHKESHYISVFSYVTLGTVLSAITAGLLHDWQRRKYLSDGDFRRKRMPIVLPLIVTTTLSVIITTLTFMKREEILYLSFILFTIYRSYLFSFEATYINDIFPLKFFTLLFGVLHSSAGLSSMLQYPLFQWFDAYPTAPLHVRIFMLCLQVSAFIHPLHVWISCRRHKGEPSTCFLNKEIRL